MERLTPHEQQKYIVIKEYDAGKLTRKQAALRLGVRAETVSRLVKAYRQHGKQAFVHKNHGNHYAVHVSPEVEAALVRLYQTDFEGFNPGPQFPDRKVVGCMAFPPSSCLG